MKIGMSPRLLQYVLIAILLIVFLGGISGFFYAVKNITDYTAKTNAYIQQASAGDKDLHNLTVLRDKLAESSSLVLKTHTVVAYSNRYRYQDTIIDDITAYAKACNIGISGYVFIDSKATSTSPSTSPTTTAPTAPTPTTTPAGAVKTTTVDVSISSPCLFTDIMRFIQHIEQNTTKMKLAGISMSRETDKKYPEGSVNIQTVKIEAYIR